MLYFLRRVNSKSETTDVESHGKYLTSANRKHEESSNLLEGSQECRSVSLLKMDGEESNLIMEDILKHN